MLLPALIAAALATSCTPKSRVQTAKSPSNAQAAAASKAELPDQINVRGTVVGYHGKPLALAHVHHDKKSVTVAPDGRFEIAIPSQGLIRLYITGVDSVDYPTFIFAEGSDIELNVQLGTYALASDFSKVAVLLEGMGSFSQAKPMAKQPDGTYKAVVPAKNGELAYELVNVTTSNSVNGTMGDGYRYDGEGNYFSTVKADQAEVTVIFDPSQLPPPEAETKLSFRDPDSRIAHISRITTRIANHQQAFFRAMTSTSPEAQANRESLSKSSRGRAKALAEKIPKTADALVRQALLIEYFALSAPIMGLPVGGNQAPDAQHRALAERGISEIPTDSPFWSLSAGVAQIMVEATGARKQHQQYLDAIIETHPDKNVSLGLAVQQLAQAHGKGELEDAKRYYSIIKTRFGDMPLARIAERFSPERKLRTGVEIPSFSLASMDDPSIRFTDSDLRGKVYMIEFWATWCKPCVAQMPRLHKLYKEHKSKGFTIVSVAMHDGKDAVLEFRAGKWPMPWNNVFVDGALQDEIKDTFEVFGLPTMILVDRQGKIVGVNESLENDGLAKLLDRVLSDKAPAREQH